MHEIAGQYAARHTLITCMYTFTPFYNDCVKLHVISYSMNCACLVIMADEFREKRNVLNENEYLHCAVQNEAVYSIFNRLSRNGTARNHADEDLYNYVRRLFTSSRKGTLEVSVENFERFSDDKLEEFYVIASLQTHPSPKTLPSQNTILFATHWKEPFVTETKRDLLESGYISFHLWKTTENSEDFGQHSK